MAAAVAYRRAVRTAAVYGAASAACQVMEADIAETRRRLRAITERWIPRLESRLGRLRQELDEAEREESYRRHRGCDAELDSPARQASRESQ
jgi:V/A-type H+-transporting ATPase subunit D